MSDTQRDTQLDPTQLSVVDMALHSPISIMCGAAGTGKSTVLRRLASRVRATSGESILFVAVTGKAVQVIKASVGDDETCMTIDMLLVTPAVVERFRGGWIAFDEVSMCSVIYLYRLLNEMKPRRLLLCGDDGQLPPVGAAGVLRDLLAVEPAKLPRVRLIKVYRQTGDTALVRNLSKLRLGTQLFAHEFESDGSFMMGGGNDFDVTVTDLIQATPRPVVLCLTNETRGRLNLVCQGVCNSQGRPLMGDLAHIRLGDPVMCVENAYERGGEERVSLVSNGTLGVVRCRDDVPIVVYENGHEDVFDFRAGRFATDFEMAYVLTVDKSQGSEFDAVVVVFDDTRRRPTRELLYTAMSRAKACCVLLCNPASVSRATAPVPVADTIFITLLAEALAGTQL